MSGLNEEERSRIINATPVGTWVVMGIFGIVFIVAWLYFYFGIFLPRGTVN